MMGYPRISIHPSKCRENTHTMKYITDALFQILDNDDNNNFTVYHPILSHLYS
jgi:hypothetical protein